MPPTPEYYAEHSHVLSGIHIKLTQFERELADAHAAEIWTRAGELLNTIDDRAGVIMDDEKDRAKFRRDLILEAALFAYWAILEEKQENERQAKAQALQDEERQRQVLRDAEEGSKRAGIPEVRSTSEICEGMPPRDSGPLDASRAPGFSDDGD